MPSASELRRTRDALVERLASTADEMTLLEADAPEPVREAWIAHAGSYVRDRQEAVDRLAEIDAALGGEAPDPTCRGALERILAADRLLLADAGRLMAEIQEESAGQRRAVRVVRRYAPTEPFAPLLRRAL